MKTKTTKTTKTKTKATALGERTGRAHTVQAIPFGAIRAVQQENARRHIGDVSELAASIAAQGLLEPLVVTRDPSPQGTIDADGETYTPPQTWALVAGFKRHAALRSLGTPADQPINVTCLDAEVEAADILAINLVENLQREDLHPYDMALAFLRLATEHDLSGPAIARRVGKSGGYVNNLMRAHRDLAPAILERWAAHDPAVSPRVAIELSALPVDQQLARWTVILASIRGYQATVTGSDDDGEGEGGEGGKGGGTKATPKKASDKMGRPLPSVQAHLAAMIRAADVLVKLPADVAGASKAVTSAYLLGVRAALEWTSGAGACPVVVRLAPPKRGRPLKVGQ